MLQSISFFFAGTLRRQLISGVAIVHAVLMALFVWDLTVRQKALLLERQIEHAQALSQSVATSSAGWVGAKDYYGLQEIITAQLRYPELIFAMIIDNDGRILAHSETSRIGQYLSDLPEQYQERLLSVNASLVDAVNPIILSDNPIGWARIGLGQTKTAEKLNQVTIDGIIYTFFAIVIGSLLAFIMANRLTDKLRKIQFCADEITSGAHHVRAPLIGHDEVSHVASAFNTMIDSMVDANQRVEIAKDAAQLGIFEYDLIKQRLLWDDWMLKIYGFNEQTFSGKFEDWSKVVHPEDLERVSLLIEEVVNGNKEFKCEFRIFKSKDQIRWIKADAVVIYNEDGLSSHLIGVNQDITEKKEKEKLIEQQANYDALTLLPNRKLFQELLELEIQQAIRNDVQLWVFFVDLDGFKEVNDSFGHHLGDELLIQVSSRLQKTLRTSDVVARLGGDEFVIILSCENNPISVDTIASKIIKNIAVPYKLNNQEIFISASIGIANYPNDAKTTEDLLKFADQSMYEAKKDGKNRYNYFTPALQKASMVRMELSVLLRQAISEDQFQLYYQPIVELQSLKVHKAEALIRWIHPEKGVISPASFIPLAEETGTICDIGNVVFDKAFLQLKQWIQKNNEFQLSVNMSPYQLKVNDDKYHNWQTKLKSHQIPGEHVVIEITEGLLLKSNSIVNKRLLSYRDDGVQVAIDDFGTGYSSLSYLKEFDIDYLKIDQSFIRNLSTHSSEHSLTEAIIVMAHKLGLKVIAEGVETEQQLALLKEMDCDYAQGYYFSKPVPSKEFEQLYF
ncbi:MAG: EAL domain-containing protein [Gammaproteobacteria bacterium]|nr:EAL domain-containing protein [Gammaproteobacteria bacterium]